MSLPNGNIAHIQITKSTTEFSLEGKIQPSFYNDGNTPVKIMNKTVEAGKGFVFDFPIVPQNSIAIEFNEAGVPNPINKVNVYWATIITNC